LVVIRPPPRATIEGRQLRTRTPAIDTSHVRRSRRRATRFGSLFWTVRATEFLCKLSHCSRREQQDRGENKESAAHARFMEGTDRGCVGREQRCSGFPASQISSRYVFLNQVAGTRPGCPTVGSADRLLLGDWPAKHTFSGRLPLKRRNLRVKPIGRMGGLVVPQFRHAKPHLTRKTQSYR
jgi:hypothetical protein